MNVLEILPPTQDVAAPPVTPRHPLGAKARILLTSVCGPYAQDDEFGSRAINPMELYHNQVTRVQGPFSLRMFHRSWGIMLIASNISAPCTVLDFPLWERFEQELRDNTYDVIGISSIIANIGKVKQMIKMIRKHQPNAKIVIGGHIANIPDLMERVKPDFAVKGDGIRWFRNYVGDNPSEPINHPLITSGYGTRCLGVKVNDKTEKVAATLIPSVGCPLGCNFCSTSAMFGGKGKHIDFFENGDELFDIMMQLSDSMGVESFFIMDENFLLHRPRALRVLELMQQYNKAWSLYVFSSANALRKYTFEQLAGLGISWVWMGLEGEESEYRKLSNIDAFKLISDMQSHGIRILGSSIIGLEEHTPENMDAAIEYACDYRTDFHQFMLYTPLSGTPLHAQLKAEGRLKSEEDFDFADIHGQHKFAHRHSHIPDGAETDMLVKAFQRDFERNGPSVVRITETTLAGWKRYHNHADPRIRARYLREGATLATTDAALVAATRRYYRGNAAMYEKMTNLLDELIAIFGWKARLAAQFGGAYVHWTMQREANRLKRGWTYEPPSFYECNQAALNQPRRQPAKLIRCVVPNCVQRTPLVVKG